jgi:hypothetical protein
VGALSKRISFGSTLGVLGIYPNPAAHADPIEVLDEGRELHILPLLELGDSGLTES